MYTYVPSLLTLPPLSPPTPLSHHRALLSSLLHGNFPPASLLHMGVYVLVLLS